MRKHRPAAKAAKRMVLLMILMRELKKNFRRAEKRSTCVQQTVVHLYSFTLRRSNGSKSK
jgi:hypothetical protein